MYPKLLSQFLTQIDPHMDPRKALISSLFPRSIWSGNASAQLQQTYLPILWVSNVGIRLIIKISLNQLCSYGGWV